MVDGEARRRVALHGGLTGSGHFQADNGCDERADEEDAGECDRLVEEDYPDSHCPDGTYARPHRVGRAYGYCLYGLGQQQHTCSEKQQEAGAPQPVFQACQPFHLAQTECEAGLAKAGYNQNHPVHIKSHFMHCVLRLQNYPFLA